MATIQAKPTPESDTTPAAINIEDELSGSIWCDRYRGSSSELDLINPFKDNAINFLNALRTAGGIVKINATYRPPERAYLMHWAWRIAKGTSAASAPKFDGVNIQWVHENEQKSRAAATKMVEGYGIGGLNIAPALKSRHTEGNAIDMNISWNGALVVINALGNSVEIKTLPKDGMNVKLHEVGKSYGVIKFYGGVADRPHWSSDGR